METSIQEINEVIVNIIYKNSPELTKTLEKLHSLQYNPPIDPLIEYFRQALSIERGITMISDKEVDYEPIKLVHITDTYDESTFDVLFGRMKCQVQLPGGAFFPNLWRLHRDATLSINLTPVAMLNSHGLSSGSDLKQWIMNVLKSESKDPEYANIFFRTGRSGREEFFQHGIDKPEDLVGWKKEDFDRYDVSPTIRNILMAHVAKLGKGSKEKRSQSRKEKKKSVAEEIAACHNIKRFFLYHVSIALDREADIIDDVPYLDKDAITTAMEEIIEFFAGEQLLKDIEEQYMSYTLPRSINYVRISRGILLYGPPGNTYNPCNSANQMQNTHVNLSSLGTGKTTLTDTLPRRVGFFAMSPALASAEVNRSLVGETEELLQHLLSRALNFPHLLCSISVDEIDGLAPKRDDKSSQSKNDSLSMLLSLIGGIKDVPNLVFMASTNRLKMMDQAFLRRMNAQFFVGRPNPAARKKILSRINEELTDKNSSVSISDDNIRNLVTWTTNFSGAALDILVSDVIVFVNRYLQPRGGKEVDNKDFLRIAHKVSEQFSLSIGSSSLASIFNDILDCPDKLISDILDVEHIPRNFPELYTGLIIADLSRGRIIVETKTGEHNELRTDGPTTIKELLFTCVKFTTALNLDSIQMFDMDMLLGNAAYDDSKAAEIIQEKIDECTKYAKSIAIIDLDSIVGLTDSESSSNMGLSSSYSIANMRMFSLMMNILEKKNISSTESTTTTASTPASQGNSFEMTTRDGRRIIRRIPVVDEVNKGSTANKQMWVVAATAKDFMLKALRREKQIKLTKVEEEEQREEEEKSKKKLRCVLCSQDYRESDNDKLNCNYHCGSLFYPDQDPDLWCLVSPSEVSTKAGEIFNTKQATMKDKNASPSGFIDELPKFRYLCCLNPYKHQGCRKGDHVSDENALTDILEDNRRVNHEELIKIKVAMQPFRRSAK
jgi:hypothetical protein